MSFDTILGIIWSVLLPKLFENIAREKNIKFHIFSKMLMISGIFLFIANISNIVDMFANENVKAWYSDFVCNNFFRALILIVLIIMIFIVYGKDVEGTCDFTKLSDLIEKFTNQLRDNDVIYILCGDMDVWGTDYENSKELQQLIRLQQNNKYININILCKHCMEDSLIEEIVDQSYDFDKLQSETRINPEQVKRIAYFKQNLKCCEFRFYKEPKEDRSNLRARVIISNGSHKVLIYRQNNARPNKIMEWAYSIIKKEYEPYIYEYKEFNSESDYQCLHYAELCELKWRGCDKKLASKIMDFCERYSNTMEGTKSLKKIAFIYAKTYEIAHYGEKRKEFPPFGVLYLAAAVREQCPEWTPHIIAIEEGEETDAFINEIQKYDVAAFSVVSAYTVPVFEKCMIAISKCRGGNKPLCIAGGFQAEQEAERWVKSKYVSLVLKGEGEKTIVQLLNGKYKDKKHYKTIPGASYQINVRGNSEYKTIPIASEHINLDEIPIPARELLAEEDYIMNDRLAGTNYKMAHVMFSRGCSYNCAYCGVRRDGNRQVRYRSPKNIIGELEILKNKGIEGFSIIDDCFLTDKQKAIEIIREVKSVNLKWSLAARIDQIDDEVLIELKESGCLEIKFGLETGSDILLERMMKGFTIEKARETIQLVKKYDIGVKVFIISGLPGETLETNNETEMFLSEMGTEYISRISLLRFVPLPGSKIYETPEIYGIKRNIKDIPHSSYRLYETETDWWQDENDYKVRNEIYTHIKNHIISIWGAC